MNLKEELAAQERTWQEWLSDNDDAEHDELIRAAFEAGFVAGTEYARKESREEHGSKNG
jgi:hypothetical protein